MIWDKGWSRSSRVVNFSTTVFVGRRAVDVGDSYDGFGDRRRRIYRQPHDLRSLDRGEAVVVLDNLSTGIRGLVSEKADFVQGEAGDMELVRRVISDFNVDAVIHFAGSIVVPESVAEPLKYYANNTVVSRALAQACVDCGVRNFIFSSTAAVYGMGDGHMVTEEFGKSADQSLWPLQADDGVDAAGRGERVRLPLHRAALFQCRRRGLKTAHWPVDAARDTSDQARLPGRSEACLAPGYFRH